MTTVTPNRIEFPYGIADFEAKFDTGGPFKQLFKSVKEAAEGQGLERAFVTGVSPVALNDVTSGFNTAEDVTHEPDLAALCGFHESEIRQVLERIAAQRELPAADVDRHLEIMRVWYNGYRFTDRGGEPVYNPTNVLYFLKRLARTGEPPRDLHDPNLRSDRGKIAFIARTSVGSGLVEELTEGDGTVGVSKLKTEFSLEDLADRIQDDPGTVASFLYYLGILTHARAAPGRLRVPNLVVRKLFLDHLLEIYVPDHQESYELRMLATAFFADGDLTRLLAFFEHRLLPVLSNRDRGAAPAKPWHSGGGVNAVFSPLDPPKGTQVIKALFLAILFDDERYLIFPELEAERGYADLCLLVRPELRTPEAIDLLFEFKLVRRKELGKSGQELRDMSEAELRGLPAVANAFDTAREQLTRYQQALETRYGDVLALRSYAIVAVDLERVLGEEI